jgi:hypothetical protein
MVFSVDLRNMRIIEISTKIKPTNINKIKRKNKKNTSNRTLYFQKYQWQIVFEY